MIGQNFVDRTAHEGHPRRPRGGEGLRAGRLRIQPVAHRPPSEAGDLAPVYGCITVDPDLNITVELSLDSAFAADSPYNTTISIQCTPTFDNQAA